MSRPVFFYAITHLASGLSYVGSTLNLKTRWSQHRGKLRRGGHHCRALQAAWQEHGEAAFAFSVIEEIAGISDADRVRVECSWMGTMGHYNETEPGLRGETFAHGARVRNVLRQKAIARADDPAARAKLRAGVKAAWDNPERRAAQAERNRQRWAKEGEREAMAEKSRAWMTTEAARERNAEHNRRLWDNPAYAEKMTRLGKERMSDPDFICRVVTSRKEMKVEREARGEVRPRKPAKPHTAETRARLSELAKARWADPEYHKRQQEILQAALASDVRRSARLGKRASPEARAKMSATHKRRNAKPTEQSGQTELPL